MDQRIPVAVLGATGMVGQRFLWFLDGHPWFRVVALTASEGRVGRRYADAVTWLLPQPMPAWAADMVLQPTTPEGVGEARLAFSALPTSVARAVEPRLAARGVWVCSNASAYRREPDVPLLVPEVNPEHIALVERQRRERGWAAAIVTNPNCTTTGLVVALAPLHRAFGLKGVFVATLQALSGAGYPGVPSLAVVDNVLPHIPGEEEKVEWEPRKILGHLVDETVELAPVPISAHTHRVPVWDGHTLAVSVVLARNAGPEEVVQALASYQAPEATRDLPSAPRPVILVRTEPDRPQPRLDRDAGRGMTTVVGRVRSDPLGGAKFTVLSHNTVRGAAGGAVYNGEWLARYLGWR